MNYPLINIALLAGSAGIGQIQNEYVQYGAAGILISILVWYARSTYLENLRRDKNLEKEALRRDLSHEKEKTELIESHHRDMKEERNRYHELHLEVLAIFKMDKQ